MGRAARDRERARAGERRQKDVQAPQAYGAMRRAVLSERTVLQNYPDPELVINAHGTCGP
eukprot:1501674-Rhodomonas_salina.2